MQDSFLFRKVLEVQVNFSEGLQVVVVLPTPFVTEMYGATTKNRE